MPRAPRLKLGAPYAPLAISVPSILTLASPAAAQSVERTTTSQIDQDEPPHPQQLHVLNVDGSQTVGDGAFADGLVLHHADEAGLDPRDPFDDHLTLDGLDHGGLVVVGGPGGCNGGQRGAPWALPLGPPGLALVALRRRA